MKRIDIYTVKMVKDSSKTYNLESKKITSPSVAADIIQTVLDLNSEAVEKFGILTLNTKHEVAGIHIVSMGSLNASIVHPREVFKLGILNNAAAIILFHNHPSGDPTPSREDKAITQRLIQCGEMMGISVLDHIIVGDGRFLSLRETDESVVF